MCLRFLKFLAIVLISSSVLFAEAPLKFCADPDNLPFSNTKEQGFDNKISALIAKQLGRQAEFVWQRAGRGFVRETLDKGKCDVLVGVPSQFRQALTTLPYYSSSYVFVTRKNRRLRLNSFDDPRLHAMKIGVQVLDDDYAPPARALSRRQLTPNIVGFDVAGEESEEIIRAVANGKIDVAIVWGPLAGYYAARQRVPLDLEPVTPELDPPALPFRFSMAMAVRKSNRALKDQIEQALIKQHAQIEKILRAYSVPEYQVATQARLQR
jgi:quinoprotein dehydrogenase-associated probable ABC transporter substrate-binding protein